MLTHAKRSLPSSQAIEAQVTLSFHTLTLDHIGIEHIRSSKQRTTKREYRNRIIAPFDILPRRENPFVRVNPPATRFSRAVLVLQPACLRAKLNVRFEYVEPELQVTLADLQRLKWS